MDHREVVKLLEVREALTNEPINQTIVDAWHSVLRPWSYEQCRVALGRAANHHSSITVGHVVEHLPDRLGHPEPFVPEPRVERSEKVPGILDVTRRHLREHREHPDVDGCPICRQASRLAEP